MSSIVCVVFFSHWLTNTKTRFSQIRLVMPLCVCLGSGQWWWYHSLTPLRKCATVDLTSCVVSVDECLAPVKFRVQQYGQEQFSLQTWSIVLCINMFDVINHCRRPLMQCIKMYSIVCESFSHSHMWMSQRFSLCMVSLSLEWPEIALISRDSSFLGKSDLYLTVGISAMMLWTTYPVGEISQTRCHIFQVVDFIITLACLYTSILCAIEYSLGDAPTALKHGDEACIRIWHLMWKLSLPTFHANCWLIKQNCWQNVLRQYDFWLSELHEKILTLPGKICLSSLFSKINWSYNIHNVSAAIWDQKILLKSDL